MLSAQKLELLAGLKVRGLDLRQAEMSFYMNRFTTTAGLSSIMTCLAYVGVIKIKIPHEMLPPEETWQVPLFYVAACCTMALSMYNLVITSFCVVYAQGLALRGPPGSVAKCVQIFRAEWVTVRLVLAASLASLILAGVSISWMKLERDARILGGIPLPALVISVLVLGILLLLFRRLALLASQLRVPYDTRVEGDLHIDDGGLNIDLAAEDQERIEAAR